MRETIKVFGLSILLLFVVSYLGMQDINNALWLSIGYGLLLLLPATLYFAKKKLSFTEKFFLSTITSLCFGAVLVAGDVLFRIQLKMPVYLFFAGAFFIGGIFVWRKDRGRQR